MSLSASRLLRDEYLMDINPILCCLDPLESDVFYVLAQCNKNKIYYSPILPFLPFLTINLLVLLVFILACHLPRFCIISNILEYLVCDFVKNSEFGYYFYPDCLKKKFLIKLLEAKWDFIKKLIMKSI